MIARVALNPAGLEEVSGAADAAPADVFSRHRAICDALEAHGVIVLSSLEEQQALLKAVVALQERSTDAFAVWKELLKVFKQEGRLRPLKPTTGRSLETILSLDELRTGWAPGADIAVLTDEQATGCGVLPSEVSKVDATSGLDIAPAARAANAETIRRLRDGRDVSVLDRGEPRDRFAAEFLTPIAQCSSEVVVYDRYLFNRLKRRANEEPHSSGWDAEHVAWMLERIDAAGGDPCGVRLLGAYDPNESGFPESAQEAADLVQRYWSPRAQGAVSRVEVVAARFNPSLPHTRHVRSNIAVGITMEPGFDRFSRRTVFDSSGVEWAYRFKPRAIGKFVASERRVERDASAGCIEAFSR